MTLSALCLCGLVVLWSCGLVVLWSCGLVGFGLAALWSQVHSTRPLILCSGEMLWTFCGLSGDVVVRGMFLGSRMHVCGLVVKGLGPYILWGDAEIFLRVLYGLVVFL